MRSQVGASTVAGLVAGVVMSTAMMAHNAWLGRSLWAMPNLIAVLWMGNSAAGGEFGLATLVGFGTHMATSALMGFVAVPFIRGLPLGRTVLASFAYAVASYPVVYSAVISWANPPMMERTDMIAMTVGHAIFGITLGVTYVALRRRTSQQRERHIAAK